MASPTEAEMDAQLQASVLLLDNHLENQTVPADEDAYIQILESDFAAAQAQGARLFRQRVAAAVSTGGAVISPVLTAYTHHIVDLPERSAQRALDRIYQFFIDNNKTLQSRDITYGAIPTFAANKGVLYRLTEDENGFDLENEFVEAKQFTCIRDENTGADPHQEIFEIAGTAGGVDSLDATGSGALIRNFRARTSNDSLLRNPSFSSFSIQGSFSGGTYSLIAGDTITGWTLDVTTNFDLDQNQFARDVVGDPQPTSLVFTANSSATQTFAENRIQLNAAVPYTFNAWILPTAGTSAGTMTVTWGSKSQAFDIGSMVVGAWNEIIFDRDQDLWPASFNAEDATVVFTLTGLTGGTGIKLDELGFTAMTPFDGTWWYLSAGAAGTPSTGDKFLLDDTLTVTDTFNSVDSKIQKWLWRSFGRYLPAVTTATQVVASGGRTLTFADSNPDTVTASSGSFISDGYVVGQQLTVAGTASNNGTFTIAVVTALVITVIATDTFAAEGPLSGGETLDAGPSLLDPV